MCTHTQIGISSAIFLFKHQRCIVISGIVGQLFFRFYRSVEESRCLLCDVSGNSIRAVKCHTPYDAILILYVAYWFYFLWVLLLGFISTVYILCLLCMLLYGPCCLI